MINQPRFLTYEEFLEYCLKHRGFAKQVLKCTTRYKPFVFGDLQAAAENPKMKITCVVGFKVIKDLTRIINPRLTAEYKKWRMDVLKRDRHTCQTCGSKNNLHVHHKKKLSEYPSVSMEIDNGMTLCVTCHRKEHYHE